jgi:hypothetical protein
MKLIYLRLGISNSAVGYLIWIASHHVHWSVTLLLVLMAIRFFVEDLNYQLKKELKRLEKEIRKKYAELGIDYDKAQAQSQKS